MDALINDSNNFIKVNVNQSYYSDSKQSSPHKHILEINEMKDQS